CLLPPLSRMPLSRHWAAGFGSCAPGSASASLPFHDDGRRAVPCTERAARTVRQCQIAIPDLHRRMRLAAQLPHRLDDLGEATAIGGVVIAEPAAIGIDRQFAIAGNQIAIGDEPAALTLLAEAEILDLHQYGDREAVIDRGVFDVAGFDAGLGEGCGPRPH